MQSKTEQALKEDEVAVLKFDDNPSLPNSRNMIGPCEGGGSWQKKVPFFFFFLRYHRRTTPSIPPHLSTNQRGTLSQWLLCRLLTQPFPSSPGAGVLRRTSSPLVLCPALPRGTWSPLALTSWPMPAEYVALILRFVFIDISIANDLLEPSQPYLLRG